MVARLQHAKKSWQVCGVGNIHARIFEGMSFKIFMSHNGIIGLNLPHSLHSHAVEAQSNQVLIMASDGLGTRRDMNRYPTIFKYDNTVVGAILYKDFCRGHDDATVLVGKVPPACPPSSKGSWIKYVLITLGDNGIGFEQKYPASWPVILSPASRSTIESDGLTGGMALKCPAATPAYHHPNG